MVGMMITDSLCEGGDLRSIEASSGYVYHPEYDDPAGIRQILESLPAQRRPSTSPADELVHLRSGYTLVVRPILSPDEERGLFMTMNCLKHLAHRRLMSADGASVVSRRIAARLQTEAEQIRNEILLANQRLAVAIARKFPHGPLAQEDLIAEAQEALCRAIDAFDCHRGYRFSTYATPTIRHHLIGQLRRAATRVTDETLLPPSGLEQSVTQEAGAGERETAMRLASLLLEELSGADRHLVELRYGLGASTSAHTFRQLGPMFGVSAERIRQRLATIHETLAKKAQRWLDDQATG